MEPSPFRLIPCNIPTFDLVLKPQLGTAGVPTGRCGHPTYCDHVLFLVPRDHISAPIKVIDSMAQRPRQDMSSIVNAILNFIGIKRQVCEACRRTPELAAAIVCPCCKKTIAPGDDVGLIRPDLAANYGHRDVLPFAVRTDDGGDIVVCKVCGLRAMHQNTVYLWGGNVVLVEENRMAS